MFFSFRVWNAAVYGHGGGERRRKTCRIKKFGAFCTVAWDLKGAIEDGGWRRIVSWFLGVFPGAILWGSFGPPGPLLLPFLVGGSVLVLSLVVLWEAT